MDASALFEALIISEQLLCLLVTISNVTDRAGIDQNCFDHVANVALFVDSQVTCGIGATNCQ
jgi:hypothetical protein